MDRQPVVAGQFYAGEAGTLARDVQGYLDEAHGQAEAPTLLAMVPHAGYIFSGGVAGMTLGAARLAPTVLLLGPNHTGHGHGLAVWPQGRWEVPGGGLEVDAQLASLLLEAEPRLAADHAAHVHEHSLEVVVPFLAALDAQTTIVPIAVAEPRYAELQAVAASIARVLEASHKPVSIVVSSDMSHYISHESATKRDAAAIRAMLDLDPHSLFTTVQSMGITMCGVLPMTLGLLIAEKLGATSAQQTAYTTSGDVSGDFEQVVGYAGILVS